MSSAMQSSPVESSLSSRCGERTPLRSLENDIRHRSTSLSRLKLSTDPLKSTKNGTSFYDPEAPLHDPARSEVIHTSASCVDDTECGQINVTFKSFNCAGGEVEVSESSDCMGESIFLDSDQTVTNTSVTEDAVINDNIIAESCSQHADHPYCNSDLKDLSSEEIIEAKLSVTPDVSLSTGHLDRKCSTEEFKVVQETETDQNNVTWKSFICDGGEVEVPDVTRPLEETISSSTAVPGEILQDNTVNSSNFFDSCQQCDAEHVDHPYYCGENVIAVVSNSSNLIESETSVNGLRDITLKEFNCTGGEIEISDGIKTVDETVPLPADHLTINESRGGGGGVDSSTLASDYDVPHGSFHIDHPYCNIESDIPAPSGNPLTAQVPCNVNLPSQTLPNGDRMSHEGASVKNIDAVNGELSGGIKSLEKTCLSEEEGLICNVVDEMQESHEHVMSNVENVYTKKEPHQSVANASLLNDTASVTLNNEPAVLKVLETLEKLSVHPDNIVTSPVKSKSMDCSNVVASPQSPILVQLPQHPENGLQEDSNNKIGQGSEAKDSALGSSGHLPVLSNSEETPVAETIHDALKLLSECPSIASVLQLGIVTPDLRRASQSVQRELPMDQYLADTFGDGERSFLAPVSIDPTGLFRERLESPMPRPLFNSTALSYKPQSTPVSLPVSDVGKKLCVMPEPKAENPVLDNPLIQDGPLQQQLRQMAEFLILASGKLGLAAGPALDLPVVAPSVTPAKAARVESCSACVGTTPLKVIDHSLNTSRDFSAVDACTLTDPLLLSIPPGSLECLSKQELEQRLKSSVIVVEALVQQLAVARTKRHSSDPPSPSDLRDKLVQTDHTELSQTTMFRDLYMAALKRISDLELDGTSLQQLIVSMRDMQVTMNSLSHDTDAALSNMRHMEDIVREDHQSLVSHYATMKSLLEKSKETQIRMMQRVSDALQQKDDMKTQMEEAFTAKEAAFSAMDQLRAHCSTEMEELQKSVGSQQELLAALNTTYPEQVALNKAHTEILDSASELLAQTVEEQSSLMRELSTVRSLLQKTAPILLKLNEKAEDALRERDEHLSARDQALEEREQLEEELNETQLNLQTAREQIGDLNLQVTILTSEMGVVRQKLTEREEERAQLERNVTEMSATVSSTMAAHTFLEHALAAETAKLLEAQQEMSEAKDRADQLEMSLCQSKQSVSQHSQALAEAEEQLSQLQAVLHSQSMQIQQLQDACTQLSGVQEMNEFLQMENKLNREQLSESELTLRTNLQGLRERNLQCEDLKAELAQLQLDKKNLQEELKALRSSASASQMELGEKFAHAVTEITLLHHTLRGVANELRADLNDENPELRKNAQPAMEHRHPSSFVDSIMVALTTEREEEDEQMETPAGPDVAESPSEPLFSTKSAFTRIEPITPKKTAPQEFEPEEDHSIAADLLAELGSTVTEVASSLKLIQERKNGQLEELRQTIHSMEMKRQISNSRHEDEVFELKHQLTCLNGLVERGNQALQQKAQDEKMVTRLMAEMNEAQELVAKHKTDYNELWKEVVDLRRSLQQSSAECQFLRKELLKSGSDSTKSGHFMEEKIQLLKEVERLKANLQEMEQARIKLLDRAKRHQIIHQSNQLKSENELHMLNNMINKVRETLLSLPEVVKNCEPLQQLVEYIG